MVRNIYVEQSDFILIQKIWLRFEEMKGHKRYKIQRKDFMEAMNTLHYQRGLYLNKLLKSPSELLINDIVGICNNYNHSYGKFVNDFRPETLIQHS